MEVDDAIEVGEEIDSNDEGEVFGCINCRTIFNTVEELVDHECVPCEEEVNDEEIPNIVNQNDQNEDNVDSDGQDNTDFDVMEAEAPECSDEDSYCCKQCGRVLDSKLAFDEHLEKCNITESAAVEEEAKGGSVCGNIEIKQEINDADHDAAERQNQIAIHCSDCQMQCSVQEMFNHVCEVGKNAVKDTEETQTLVGQTLQSLQEEMEVEIEEPKPEPCSDNVERSDTRVQKDKLKDLDAFIETEVFDETDLHFGAPSMTSSRNKYKCDACDLDFAWLPDFIGHTKLANLECDLCFQVFDSCKDIAEHNSIHDEVKVFHCPFCPKQFHLCADFYAHQARHTEAVSCPMCKEEFGTEEEFKRHKCDSLTPGNDGSCRYCQKKIRSMSSLIKHEAEHRADMQSFKCVICKEDFQDMRALQKHGKSHESKKPFLCHICKSDFPVKTRLRHHMKTHLKDADSKQLCSFCWKTFPSEFAKIRHEKKHVHIEKLQTIKSYDCNKCDKVYTTGAALKQHVKVHHEGKNHKCQFCGKEYKCRSGLMDHEATHSKEKPFTCDECGKCFHNRTQLRFHKNHHSKTLYKCEICGMTTKWKSWLGTHMRLQHDNGLCEKYDERPSKDCDRCKQGFTSKEDFDAHMASHTGQAVCQICGAMMLSKGALASHMKVHGDYDAGQKEWQCDLCEKSYDKKSTLKCHKLNAHGPPAVCSFCKKEFKNKANMKIHEATVHDAAAKKFACELCPKKFKSAWYLRTHQKKMHFHEKTYKCEICDEEFRWKYSYEKHVDKGLCLKNVTSQTGGYRFVPINEDELEVVLGLKELSNAT